MRTAARGVIADLRRSAIAVEGDAVELHAMVDEAEAELLGDALLQGLQFLVRKLDRARVPRACG